MTRERTRKQQVAFSSRSGVHALFRFNDSEKEEKTASVTVATNRFGEFHSIR